MFLTPTSTSILVFYIYVKFWQMSLILGLLMLTWSLSQRLSCFDFFLTSTTLFTASFPLNVSVTTANAQISQFFIRFNDQYVTGRNSINFAFQNHKIALCHICSFISSSRYSLTNFITQSRFVTVFFSVNVVAPIVWNECCSFLLWIVSFLLYIMFAFMMQTLVY